MVSRDTCHVTLYRYMKDNDNGDVKHSPFFMSSKEDAVGFTVAGKTGSTELFFDARSGVPLVGNRFIVTGGEMSPFAKAVGPGDSFP
jgi:hypothetical protein